MHKDLLAVNLLNAQIASWWKPWHFPKLQTCCCTSGQPLTRPLGSQV